MHTPTNCSNEITLPFSRAGSPRAFLELRPRANRYLSRRVTSATRPPAAPLFFGGPPPPPQNPQPPLPPPPPPPPPPLFPKKKTPRRKLPAARTPSLDRKDAPSRYHTFSSAYLLRLRFRLRPEHRR